MRKVNRLKKEVRQAMLFRGHVVRRFMKLVSIWDLECQRCQMGASVMLDPPPNGIETFGAGLAINCSNELEERS